MLSIADEFVHRSNPAARLQSYGQELNPESYAIAKADALLRGQEARNIALGNSFTNDAFAGQRFDYMLSNPPFGVEWKKVERQIRDESQRLGFAGRFGAGLPRVNDGSLLFLQHMLVEDEARGLADRRGIQRLASLRGKCRLRRERNSQVDFRE